MIYVAFGATMVIRLSGSPTSEQVRRYTVPSDYRNKADAKVGVICHAAEHGVVEFVRFRGGTLPDGYVSPYTLHTYNPDASRKRKQSGPAEDAEQGPPAKKKKKKGKRRAEVPSHSEGSYLASVGQYLSILPSGNQTHGISGPSDMGLSQSLPVDDLCDPSQPGFGGADGSGAAHPAVFGHGAASCNTQMCASYPAVLDSRFVGSGGMGDHPYGAYPLGDAYDNGTRPARAIEVPSSESGRSRTKLSGAPLVPRRPVEPAELEPGEVVSSAESEFSESSSRNEDVEMPGNERGMRSTPTMFDNLLCVSADANANRIDAGADSVDTQQAPSGSKDKGKGRETSPANTSTAVSRDGPATGATIATTASHVKKLTGKISPLPVVPCFDTDLRQAIAHSTTAARHCSTRRSVRVDSRCGS